MTVERYANPPAPALVAARRAAAAVWTAVTLVARVLWGAVAWAGRHAWLVAGLLAVDGFGFGIDLIVTLGHPGWLWGAVASLLGLFAVLLSVIRVAAPAAYARLVRPWWQAMWLHDLRASWKILDEQQKVGKLKHVQVMRHGLRVDVKVRPGHTSKHLEAAGPIVASAVGAVAYEVRDVTPSTASYVLVMADDLTEPRTAGDHPSGELPDKVGVVHLGRRLDGTPWVHSLRGHQTLVVGCTGSGKGSILWGAVGGLAPLVSAGLVEVWGIDLKGGIELAMGRGLFSRMATDTTSAIAMLEELAALVAQRAQAMAGTTRTHEPKPGDPFILLAIDELAALTAYCDPENRKHAANLLSLILSQGRALDVSTLACIQDPRKEVLPMRGLFSATVALRLRAAAESTMVLGEGMAEMAPAHRIAKDAPGTGYAMLDSGEVTRVRADYWPDDLIRRTAACYPAPETVVTVTPPTVPAGTAFPGLPTAAPAPAPAPSRVIVETPDGHVHRKRSPRRPRTTTSDSGAAA